jgi:hypothetical protein
LSDGRFRYNLDRKDNDRGYSFDNVAVCCKECNFMKRNFATAEEFKAMRLLLKRWRESDDLWRKELMLTLVSYGNILERI